MNCNTSLQVRRLGVAALCLLQPKAVPSCNNPMPRIDDVLPKLANAKVFCAADTRNGFWHVTLDDECS